MEVSIVGDFDADELESCILRYLGTVAPKPEAQTIQVAHHALSFRSPPFGER